MWARDFTGWASTVDLYRNENTDIIAFSDDTKVLLLKQGDTYTDTFVYEFPNDFKEFVFYFPETLPIEIQVK